ncbi:MAG: hypothetical protein K1X75_04040 [Leptospirales bacterium]|nr:hypothetical protein [Leptospirales bacterium]
MSKHGQGRRPALPHNRGVAALFAILVSFLPGLIFGRCEQPIDYRSDVLRETDIDAGLPLQSNPPDNFGPVRFRDGRIYKLDLKSPLHRGGDYIVGDLQIFEPHIKNERLEFRLVAARAPTAAERHWVEEMGPGPVFLRSAEEMEVFWDKERMRPFLAHAAPGVVPYFGIILDLNSDGLQDFIGYYGYPEAAAISPGANKFVMVLGGRSPQQNEVLIERMVVLSSLRDAGILQVKGAAGDCGYLITTFPGDGTPYPFLDEIHVYCLPKTAGGGDASGVNSDTREQ